MEKYRIRISGNPSAQVDEEVRLANDFAAIRHGQRLAAPGEKLEIYRGSDCIFMSQDLGLTTFGHVQEAQL